MDIIKRLKKEIEGKVLSDHFSRHIYSVDASIYEVKPQLIVIPKSYHDLKVTIEIAKEHKVPITSRGGATSLTGAPLGEGIIIDHSMYLNQVLDYNPQEKTLICQMGAIQDDLNAYIAQDGLRLGSDTSSSSRATIGGMIGNDSSGAHSLKLGKTSDHIIELEGYFSDGYHFHFKDLDQKEFLMKQGSSYQEGRIYQAAAKIRDEGKEIITNTFPKNIKCVDGYNLPSLLSPYPINLSKLVAGSEGTLALLTQAKLNLVELPASKGLLILFYDDLFEAFSDVLELVQSDPSALEIIDHNVIEMGMRAPSLKSKLSWIEGFPKAILALEHQGESDAEVQQKLESSITNLKHRKHTFLTSSSQQSLFWQFRKLSLGLILSKRTYDRAYAFIEDFSIPPSSLVSFFKEFFPMIESFGKKGGLYGHIGSGCLHFRPFMNLSSESDQTLMEEISYKTAQLIKKNQGGLSGEHGDGLVRSWLLKDFFGEQITGYFQDIKEAFDPLNLFNPGKIVSPRSFKENLRAKTDEVKEISTFLNFEPEGGFSLAADLCNGNALCRKSEGLMCPTFQASKDERQSTRARAQSLRAIINGKAPMEQFTSKELYQILDDCLECKGCKTECPSQVDMAKIKSEFLYHYYKKNKSSLRRYIFGHFPHLLEKTSWIPSSLISTSHKIGLHRPFLGPLGIECSRPLPSPAKKRFTKLCQHKNPSHPDVALFIDTYSEFLTPQIALDALNLLTSLGKKVYIAPWSCCGRTYLSKGYLEKAKSLLGKIVATYTPLLKKGIPIISLEPSCLYTMKDQMIDFHPDYHDLFSNLTMSLETYLLKEKLELPISSKEGLQLYTHTHCHQKSSSGNNEIEKLLTPYDFISNQTLNSSCCGMAGSFGYEKEHLEMSKSLAKHSFREVMGKKSDLLIANGFSCRHQIQSEVQMKAMHIASFLSELIS